MGYKLCVVLVLSHVVPMGAGFVFSLENKMKWWRPWVKKPTAAVEPAPFSEEDEIFLLAIEDVLQETAWAQRVMYAMGQKLDQHVQSKHEFLHECDVLCRPASIDAYVTSLDQKQLEVLALLAIKYWFITFTQLRDWQNPNQLT